MEENELLSTASFWTPRSLGYGARWALHIPFAFWLVQAVRPSTIVQLGARPGGAYFAFCEAVQKLGLGSQCRAVDTRKEDPAFMDVCGEIDRRLFDRDNRLYRDFSALLSVRLEDSLAAFGDQTIDILHVHAMPGLLAAEGYIEAWLPKMSERGLVLLDQAAGDGGQHDGVMRDSNLGRRYPAFEFRHGEGLSVVAVGAKIPEKLSKLLESEEDDRIREDFRRCYERLGRGLVEELACGEVERLQKVWDRESTELSANLLEAREALGRAQNENFELESLRSRWRMNEDELERTRESLYQSDQINAALRLEREIFEDRLGEIETSLGWLFLLRLRSLRVSLFRPGTVRGRCWTLGSRFVKTAGTAGIRAALCKARERVVRKLLKYRPRRSASGTRFLGGVFRQPVPADRFRELPWRFLGHNQGSTDGAVGYFKILLVSHSACRTGAPLCLLRLADELSKLPDVECFIVLQQGGELADAFACSAPTLEVEWLVAQGINRHDVPGAIASAFHEFSSRGVAVCNTLVVSEFHRAFAVQQVEVLSWIHELPTFIALLGGQRSMEAIERASRKIMVPSQAVRAALGSRFRIDADRIRTIYNGQDARTKGLDREALRLQVRRELGLPDDARIVLGCGTVDLRKGADLFVNVARRVLLEAAGAGESPGTWFVWVGHCSDKHLLRWLTHDSRIGGVGDRIRFIGPRNSMAEYYLAGDLFALTSREDPCPLVNMEAMESGMAVVAFLGAGGAPEVLGDAGVCVPYIDQGAMAEAIRGLLADSQRRHEMGRRGRARIRGRFTWTRFMEEFLDILQTDYQYRPSQRLKVSVIVPNYRHARYLEERLQSIFDQTLAPHEIIVLDDASPDESVEVARRMARHAPVPIQVVVNEQNSGSTFRQWLKGLSLATGDLIWFAESDDSAHPLFLERLVPEFFDPDVILAYCQSALIGPDGERLSDDFLAHTDDISTERWRGRYSAESSIEAEIALSQKNTIPNASAVVFRRPEGLDFSDELVKLKFAGDWLFYSLLIRGGKVNFIPEVLNFYRRHEATVSHRSVREDTQAQESLYVKSRVFESYRVTPRAITGSLARSVLEYDQLTERMKLKRPALSANGHVANVLERIRAELDSRLIDPAALKIVLVLGDLNVSAENRALIDLANALAREHTVFLCNAQPWRLDPKLTSGMDWGLIPLEGTLGPNAWTNELEPGPGAGAREGGRRAAVLRELFQILRIDVVHSHSLAADRLVLAAGGEPRIPWLIHARFQLDSFSAAAGASAARSFASTILNQARGFFVEDGGLLDSPRDELTPGLLEKPRWILEPGKPVDQIAAACTEAYLEVRNLLAFPRATDAVDSGADIFGETRRRA